MRKPLLLPVCLLLLTATACGGSTDAPVFSAGGSWRSNGFARGEIAMTLSETARATTGAGSFVAPGRAAAFRVTGAKAEHRISLLFDFDGAADITFQGRFARVDEQGEGVVVMSGRLFGDAFQGDSIQFRQLTGEDED